MEPDLFTIEFVNKRRSVVYYVAGETIHGVVHVILGPSQKCKCKGITVSARGKAAFTRYIYMTMGYYKAMSTVQIPIPMEEKEIYLDNTQWLLDPGEDGKKEIKLSPGNYDYPFEFSLPYDLPSTFVTSSGSIAYELEIEMIVGYGYLSNPKENISFHLNSVVDLNSEPFAQLAAHPVQMEKYTTLCCCCCESGPLGFSVTVARGGYALGETIQFTAELRNQSKSRVEYVTASLFQKVIYRLPSNTEQYDITIISSVGGPSVSVEPNSEEIWTVNDLEIPPMTPTSTIERIVEVQYLLKIEMHVPDSVTTNLKHEIPILIGTVPLRSRRKASTPHTKNVNKQEKKPGNPHHLKEKNNGKK